MAAPYSACCMSAYPWSFSTSPAAVVEDGTGADLWLPADGVVDRVVPARTAVDARSGEGTWLDGAGRLACPCSGAVLVGADR